MRREVITGPANVAVPEDAPLIGGINPSRKEQSMSKTTEVLVGEVGVDSGQVIICDPAYIKDGFDNDVDFDNKPDLPKLNYSDICHTTLAEQGAGQVYFDLGHAGAGVAARSGFGDGVYPVYATYEEVDFLGNAKVLKELRIVFFEDDEDEHGGD